MTETIVRSIATLVVTAGLIGGPALPRVTADDGTPTDLDRLFEWMTGTFSSAVQAADDPEFFDVSLHMTPIWPGRADGRWLYVEQAMSEFPERPYRQRIYQLREVEPGLFESRVFTLPDPTAVIGAWREEAPLTAIAPDDLELRDGCSILLRRRGDAFVGSTLASLCESSLRGASYATSEVMVTAEGMISWDRGFDADGSQVWGATTGGYVFDRIVPDATPVPEAGPDAEPVPTPADE